MTMPKTDMMQLLTVRQNFLKVYAEKATNFIV